MRRMTVATVATVVTIAAVLAMGFASPAHAETIRTHTVTRVTFAHLADQALSSLDGVEVDSNGATITVGASGHERPVHIGFEKLARTAADDQGFGALARLLVLPTIVAVFFRALRVAAALSRRR